MVWGWIKVARGAGVLLKKLFGKKQDSAIGGVFSTKKDAIAAYGPDGPPLPYYTKTGKRVPKLKLTRSQRDRLTGKRDKSGLLRNENLKVISRPEGQLGRHTRNPEEIAKEIKADLYGTLKEPKGTDAVIIEGWNPHAQWRTQIDLLDEAGKVKAKPANVNKMGIVKPPKKKKGGIIKNYVRGGGVRSPKRG